MTRRAQDDLFSSVLHVLIIPKMPTRSAVCSRASRMWSWRRSFCQNLLSAPETKRVAATVYSERGRERETRSASSSPPSCCLPPPRLQRATQARVVSRKRSQELTNTTEAPPLTPRARGERGVDYSGKLEMVITHQMKCCHCESSLQ